MNLIEKIAEKFAVYEDNAGGLMLAVFNDNDEIKYIHKYYRSICIPGLLIDDLKCLAAGDDSDDYEPVDDWGGNDIDKDVAPSNPRDINEWFSQENEGIGWNIIADNNGICYNRMGATGREEFATLK